MSFGESKKAQAESLFVIRARHHPLVSVGFLVFLDDACTVRVKRENRTGERERFEERRRVLDR